MYKTPASRCGWTAACLSLVVASLTVSIYFSWRQAAYLDVLLGTDAKAKAPAAAAPAKPEHTLIVTELADTSRHLFYFFHMLYPSFAHVAQEAPRRCRVSLAVFCEPGACPRVAHACPPRPPGSGACGCFSVPLAPAVEVYNFMHSLRFLTLPSFKALLASGAYTWFLRTDTDAIICPGVLRWTPAPYLAAAGQGFSGETFTHNRTRRIAKALGLRHQGVQNMQSTVMLHSSVAGKAFDQMVNLTDWFHKHEFTEEKCRYDEFWNSTFAKEFRMQGTGFCKWPFWYKPVSSLYAQDLALNAFVPAIAAAGDVPGGPGRPGLLVSDRLDSLSRATDWSHGGTYDQRPADEVLQVHLLELKGDRLPHSCYKQAECACDRLDSLRPASWEKHHPNGTLQGHLGSYVDWIVWQALQQSCIGHKALSGSGRGGAYTD